MEAPRGDAGELHKLTMQQWQLVCEGRLLHDLQVWEQRMLRGPMQNCVGELQRDLATATKHKRLRFLFTFLPHAKEMAVYGTTPNEGGHQRLNRRTKFVTQMRPDNTAALLKHTVLLANRDAAAKAAKSDNLPVAVRELCAELFVHRPGVPFQAVAARAGVPYIMSFRAPEREYSRPEYEAHFAMCGGLVL